MRGLTFLGVVWSIIGSFLHETGFLLAWRNVQTSAGHWIPVRDQLQSKLRESKSKAPGNELKILVSYEANISFFEYELTYIVLTQTAAPKAWPSIPDRISSTSASVTFESGSKNFRILLLVRSQVTYINLAINSEKGWIFWVYISESERFTIRLNAECKYFKINLNNLCKNVYLTTDKLFNSLAKHPAYAASWPVWFTDPLLKKVFDITIVKSHLI